MKKITTLILTIGIVLIPLAAFALWNCELEVANDGDTDDTMSTENESWGYDPCIVGDLDKGWLEKQGLTQDKHGYYNDCRSIKSVVERINENQDRCAINSVKGNVFNFILFQTNGFGDPNYSKPPGCGGKSEADCLWEKYNTYNGGSQKITETAAIGKDGDPRTVVIAGYNVFMPSDRGKHYTCLGDPKDDGGDCDHFANNCNGSSFGPACPDNWEMRLIENEVSLDHLDSKYPEESPIHPANWNSGTGEVTIFAGNRTQCPPSQPCGSYSTITFDVKDGLPAFTVSKGSTLILRDLLIKLKSGHIQVKGTLITANVVFNYSNDNPSPQPAIVIEKGGVVHLTDPNPYSETALLKSDYQGHGKFQFGVTRFIMQDGLFPALGPDFAYIKTAASDSLKTNDHDGNWINLIFDLSTKSPDKHWPVVSGKKAACSVFIDEHIDNIKKDGLNYRYHKTECQPGLSSFAGKDCLKMEVFNADGDPFIATTRTKFPEKEDFDWTFEDSRLSFGFICGDTFIDVVPRCPENKYLTKDYSGFYTCQSVPSNGNGWAYNEKEFKFDCTGSLTQDGACITECPYGMEYSKEANNCVCKADKAPHTITYWFMDDNGTVTQDKKLDICYTPCPEGKVNEIDTYTLKISAPVGETIYSLTPVFTGADKCICPEGLTDSPFGCINAPAKQKECLEQNTTAVNGSFSWDGSDYACPFKCNAGFYELSNGVCRINCDSKGEIATSDGNSCVCDTANHWVPYSGGGCKCEEGHTLSGNACVPDNDPVVECSSDSDCDDNEACKDGECHPKEPEPPGGECDSDTDCGTGMLCSSAKECECDTVNGWVYDSSTGMCEYKEDPAIDIICKLNGGTYIQKEAYCEYDPKVAACKVSGKKWDEAEKACLADDDNERPNTGSGCGNIGSAGLPQNFGALLPYLLILGFVSLRGALATKRSPANK